MFIALAPEVQKEDATLEKSCKWREKGNNLKLERKERRENTIYDAWLQYYTFTRPADLQMNQSWVQ